MHELGPIIFYKTVVANLLLVPNSIVVDFLAFKVCLLVHIQFYGRVKSLCKEVVITV